MTKLIKLVCLLLVLTLPLAVFAGCTNQPEETPLSTIAQLDVLLNALQNNTQKISGSLTYEGQATQIFDGVISRSDLKLSLIVDDVDYYYSGRVLLKSSNNKYFVENSDTTLAEQKNLIPYNLLYFDYSENNSNNIFMGKNTIGISFANRGAVLSFHSDLEVSEGLLSLYFIDNKILTSIFTAKDSSGKKIVATYNYQQSEYVWNKAPEVTPLGTLNYANYLIALLSQKYEGYTIHTKDNYNTDASIGDISTEKVKTVTSVDITEENKYYSLTLTYTTKVMIVGIGSAITTLTLTYDKEYTVSSIRINQTDYVVKDPLV